MIVLLCRKHLVDDGNSLSIIYILVLVPLSLRYSWRSDVELRCSLPTLFLEYIYGWYFTWGCILFGCNTHFWVFLLFNLLFVALCSFIVLRGVCVFMLDFVERWLALAIKYAFFVFVDFWSFFPNGFEVLKILPHM